MDFLIGIMLIMFGAPLVGVAGHILAGTGRRRLGRVISVGGYLSVMAVALWLVFRDM
ncbi:hypothetical protein OIB37_12065 [Streptomyces sp. NBC_00820]|uniref:hypothetical protein n=1 Tax=Streptomyces sp. NBC_00820 TaxID=2975842 RepID=UPI002ED343D0|nr:hypothetical protein OIB37_12065 [Streptomyces sp. NBC_00820]